MSLFGEDPRRIEQLEIKTTSFADLLTEIRIKVGTLEARIDGVRTDVTNLQTRVGSLPTKTVLMWAGGILVSLLALFSVLYYNEFSAKIDPFQKELNTVAGTVDQLKITVDGLNRPVPSSAPTSKP